MRDESRTEMDKRNGTFFAALHNQRLRFSWPQGRWFLRHDERWTPCDGEELLRSAAAAARCAHAAARQTGRGGTAEQERRARLRRRAVRMQERDGMAAMVREARHELSTDLFIEMELSPQEPLTR